MHDGMRSDAFEFAAFMAFVFIAVFLFLFIRGLLNSRFLKYAVFFEFAAVFMFGQIFRSYFSGQEIEYYHTSLYSWRDVSKEACRLGWGYYTTLAVLVIAIISALLSKKARPNGSSEI